MGGSYQLSITSSHGSISDYTYKYPLPLRREGETLAVDFPQVQLVYNNIHVGQYTVGLHV